jgi:anaerobic sulfite reductase subunit C
LEKEKKTMQWSPEAEEAVCKVPFFVRKRVRARVEEEARQAGKTIITLAEVKATQKRYLNGMSAEVKGYQLDTCFGPSGCPNRIQGGDGFVEKIEGLIRRADLLSFLKATVQGELKFHHEFRVTLADCPNACSQPQIKDIGIIAACRPKAGDTPCSGCGACVETCREAAIQLDDRPVPVIQSDRCVACGQCLPICPTRTLVEQVRGYRVQLGGKLGRHPQLARELNGIFDQATVLKIVQSCLDLYKTKSRRGQRFGDVLTLEDFKQLNNSFASLD